MQHEDFPIRTLIASDINRTRRIDYIIPPPARYIQIGKRASVTISSHVTGTFYHVLRSALSWSASQIGGPCMATTDPIKPAATRICFVSPPTRIALASSPPPPEFALSQWSIPLSFPAPDGLASRSAHHTALAAAALQMRNSSVVTLTPFPGKGQCSCVTDRRKVCYSNHESKQAGGACRRRESSLVDRSTHSGGTKTNGDRSTAKQLGFAGHGWRRSQELASVIRPVFIHIPLKFVPKP